MMTEQEQAKALRELEELGDRLREIREAMLPHSPNHAIAFQLASLIGKIQGEVSVAPTEPDDAS